MLQKSFFYQNRISRIRNDYLIVQIILRLMNNHHFETLMKNVREKM